MIKPLAGIEVAKFQPIVKVVQAAVTFTNTYVPPRSLNHVLANLIEQRVQRNRLDGGERERQVVQNLVLV